MVRRLGSRRGGVILGLMDKAFPSHVSAADLARLFSVTRGAITKLVNKRVLRKKARGFEVISSFASYLAYREGLVAAKHGGGPFGEARTRLLVEKANMAQLQREKMEGSAIPAPEVEERWTSTCAAIKNKFVGMPSKLAAQLATESTPAGCQKILRDEVNENLEDLSRGEFVQKASK
jgi:phage terminase Nu1 subunit (DNA packaging protein)